MDQRPTNAAQERPKEAIGPFLRAVVTDLDGVLTDTETTFLRAVDALLNEEGLASLVVAEARGLVGLDNASIWERLCGMRPFPLSLDEYTRRVDALARVLFERELVPAPGALRLLEGVRSRGLPLALATSAEREWVWRRLQLLGLTSSFDVIITGDQVSRPKPDPEIYLTATAALGVPPGETLGLEDSPSGVRSARSAGLYTIAVRTTWTAELDLGEAHQVVDSLTEIDLDALSAAPMIVGGSRR